ncbi:MAG: thioredoxin domain-containing protein [Bryobacterales bacterium]|nr:thioredoxin domain-containing protein [Bryobacterales bacterium]
MHSNRLAREKSPYLLQHAHNPVDWYPWGEEAFEKARKEDKPIFLSIGYSTCHWCHVMERESFESESIAAILNDLFVPIKVDREERPDVDRVYMTFVQATTGGGGWPMSVWLTPDLKPFYGGTYFPPDNRFGRPGFRAVLEHIGNAWKSDRAKIVESGDDVIRQLRQMVRAKIPGGVLDERVAESCFYAFRRGFDGALGGFGGAPKFPRPAQFHFLHRYAQRMRNEEAIGMSLLTLREMYKGGMYDQLGGGFHRYSVDARWFVPHFEKMLYDQAQLAVSYLEASQISGEAFYAGVARETLEYVLRDMTDGGGGFYSAEDADSVIDPADPKHKGEGAFYIWDARELEEVVRKPESDWFAYRYGVAPGGNVLDDPHGEFRGRNILHQAHGVEETAARFGQTPEGVERALAAAIPRLLERRAARVRPHLDDKVLTSWNGLMISAFAKGAQVLGEARYQRAAEDAVRFVLGHMYEKESGILLRRWRAAEAAIPGFLDDYALFATALLDLYEVNFDITLLEQAEALARKLVSLFEDTAEGGFFSTAAGDDSLVLRVKDDYDGAEPSGNSAAVNVLLRLGQITGDALFTGAAGRALQAFAGKLSQHAITLPLMAAAYLYQSGKPKQIILVGGRDSEMTRAMLTAVHGRFLPEAIVLLVDSEETRQRLGRWLGVIRDMKFEEGRTTAYVCENYTCQMPVSDLDQFIKLLE